MGKAIYTPDISTGYASFIDLPLEESIEKIYAIEAELSKLPRGYISRKTINGKIQNYLQWSENGKKRSKYIDDSTAEALRPKIEYRRALQKDLKELKHQAETQSWTVMENSPAYFMTVIQTGSALKEFISSAVPYRKRRLFSEIRHYLEGNSHDKVLILYGLRRTGKTTLLRQAILEMNREEFSKTAFIQLHQGNTMANINHDLQVLRQKGYRNIFIDEVTLMEDFIENAALFADIFATSGMKIILSGTDSLGFMFSRGDQLYDRCILLHTTFIPYLEFEDVLGQKGIENYLRYGGTMCIDTTRYNGDSPFATNEKTNEYIDSTIARNIQHSLRCYQNEGHFRHLRDLYENNELTSAINRIVEDINRRFTIDILTRDFISHDFGLTAGNLRRDKATPTDLLDRIDKESLTKNLKECLEILNYSEQQIAITEAHCEEIREYLKLLDLTSEIPIESFPVPSHPSSRTVIIQPGLRFSQAKSLVEQLMKDMRFQSLSALVQQWLIHRMLSEISGRMMEDIILLETQLAHPEKKVFKLQFAVGEFDMVISTPETITTELFEIKHSDKTSPEQIRHLNDKEKCDATEFRYGKITRKAVIYCGPSFSKAGIDYINAEEYLKKLYLNP